MTREIRYSIAEETLPFRNPESYARCLTTRLETAYPGALVVVALDARHSSSQLIVYSDDIDSEEQIRDIIKALYDHYEEEGTV